MQPWRAGEIEKRLIDRQRLDERRQSPHRGAHLTSDRLVLRHVGPDHNSIGAGCQRLEHRHRGAHAVNPRHVAARKHDAAGTATDDNRTVGELGPVALFDARVKGVAIDMRDGQAIQLIMAHDAW
jgi:hypothetical protein